MSKLCGVEVRERPTKRGLVYSIRWKDANGKYPSKTIGMDKREAQAAAYKKKQELKQITVDGGSAIDPSWEEIKGWPNELKLSGLCSESTAVSYFDALKTFERFGAPKFLSGFTAKYFRKYRKWCLTKDRRLTPSTINGRIGSLSGLLTNAVIEKWLTVNTVKGFSKIDEPVPEINAMTFDQVEAMICAAETEMDKCMVRTFTEAGLRRAELDSLKWDQINRQTGEIRVQNQNGQKRKSQSIDDIIEMSYTTKTKRSVRTVRVQEATLDMLKRMYMTRPTGNDKVFYPTHSIHYIRYRFEKIIDMVGIYCKIHDLRRTCCTWLLEARMPVHVVKNYMGHSTVLTTLKYYAKVNFEEIDMCYDAMLLYQAMRGDKREMKARMAVGSVDQIGVQNRGADDDQGQNGVKSGCNEVYFSQSWGAEGGGQ